MAKCRHKGANSICCGPCDSLVRLVAAHAPWAIRLHHGESFGHIVAIITCALDVLAG